MIISTTNTIQQIVGKHLRTRRPSQIKDPKRPRSNKPLPKIKMQANSLRVQRSIKYRKKRRIKRAAQQLVCLSVIYAWIQLKSPLSPSVGICIAGNAYMRGCNSLIRRWSAQSAKVAYQKRA